MSQSSWIGKTLSGRYQIQEMLGQGGMSAVYKAQDPNLRRVVAVKLIHGHLSSDAEFVRRFQEEGAAVARLRHPNIIQVFDFNHDGDTYYIVFEFIPGESLQGHLKRLIDSGRKMGIDDVTKHAANVCDALDYAHKQGIVHRDVKPANIMLNVQNQAILMDFGIVKIVGGDSHTATGAVVGTARYISPEQIRGEQIDGRSDVYAMGVVLYEMLSGQPPFKADSAMTLMMMHINDPVPDIRDLRSDVPPDLAAVVQKALAKNPNERYQSAAEMARALRAVGQGGITAAAATAAAATSPAANVDATVLEPTPVPPSRPAEKAAPAAVAAAAGAAARTGSTTAPPVTAPPVSSSPPPAVSARAGGNRRMLIMGGVGLIAAVVLCLAAVFIVLNLTGDGNDEEGTAVAESTAAAELTATAESAGDELTQAAVTVAVAQATAAPTDAPTATATPTRAASPTLAAPTNTAEPTNTPEPTRTPTSAAPTGPFVRINSIGLDGNAYVVNFEIFNYTISNPGMHIHFFFNTVPPQNAGVGPTQETWYVYFGGSPFTGYTVNDRPSGATQMCALVANQDHTIQLNTGNCVALP
jgi:hypothetical protein